MDSWYCDAPFDTCVTPQHIVWGIEVVFFLANKWQCIMPKKETKPKKKKERKKPEKQQQQHPPPKKPKTKQNIQTM